MSKLFKPGSVIQKGYTISITSWENDGDDYDDNFIKGLPDVYIVNEVLHVVKWFSHAADDMGNDDIAHEEILSRLWDCVQSGIITKEFFDRFLPDVEFPTGSTDEEHDDWLDRVAQADGYEVVGDMVREFCGYPVQYEYDFARMVERVNVYYFDEDFKVPDMPGTVAKFDGSWGERNSTKEWKL